MWRFVLNVLMFVAVSVFALAAGPSEAHAQCASGQVRCSNGCMPVGNVCCGSCGSNCGTSCPSGDTCVRDGDGYLCRSSGGGGGGGCDTGYVQCGADYCMPSGRVCCASVGRPDASCPSGSTCQRDGTCSSGDGGGGGGGGGGGCNTGQVQCGSNYCIPSGSVCCASVGRADRYCPSGSTCRADGTCFSGDGGGGGGGTTTTLCTNTCSYAFDGDCDDGGPGSDFSLCPLGTDCGDCGPRIVDSSGNVVGGGGTGGGSGGGSPSGQAGDSPSLFGDDDGCSVGGGSATTSLIWLVGLIGLVRLRRRRR